MSKISFTGDLLCYPNMTEKYGDNYGVLFSKLQRLKECDCLVGNLETPIAGAELRYTYERYRFNTPVGFLTSVKKAGFNLLALANNHCMDRGERGLINTLKNCEREGLETIGVYSSKKERDKVFVKEIKGVKVAFINYTYGTNAFVHGEFLSKPFMVNMFQPEETKRGSIDLLADNIKIGKEVERIYVEKQDYEQVKPYLKQLKSDIEKAKKNADYVVMIMHCGGQYTVETDPYSKFLAKKIREYGADVIVGHHSHTILKSEINDGFVTAYSLGNFMCDPKTIGEKEIDYRYNVVFHLILEKKDGKVSAKNKFSIYKMVDDGESLYAIDTFDLYKETQNEKLKKDIIYFANRFVGGQKFDCVQEIYDL